MTGIIHIIIGASPYYRYDVYYAPYGNRYRVVEEPKESENATEDEAEKTDKAKTGQAINTDYEKIVLEGRTYYKKGDKYYKASVNASGEIVYEEVGETTQSK